MACCPAARILKLLTLLALLAQLVSIAGMRFAGFPQVNSGYPSFPS
jgi:hypothetical protein